MDGNDCGPQSDSVWEAMWPQSIVETLSLSSPNGQYYALQLIANLSSRNRTSSTPRTPSNLWFAAVRRRAFVLANAPDAVKKLSVSQDREVSQLAPRVAELLTNGPEKAVWQLGPVSIPRFF